MFSSSGAHIDIIRPSWALWLGNIKLPEWEVECCCSYAVQVSFELKVFSACTYKSVATCIRCACPPVNLLFYIMLPERMQSRVVVLIIVGKLVMSCPGNTKYHIIMFQAVNSISLTEYSISHKFTINHCQISKCATFRLLPKIKLTTRFVKFNKIANKLSWIMSKMSNIRKREKKSAAADFRVSKA